MGFKDSIKEMFPTYSPKTEFAKFFAVNMASGGLAGAGSLLIVYPLDFARTRLAADVGSGKNREFTGLVDCLTKVAKRSGPMSLYQGFGVSVQGIVMGRGAYFGLYDTAKGAIFGEKEKDASILAKWAVAQTVTIASGIISYPFDTVRRRLMMGRKGDQAFQRNARLLVQDCQERGYGRLLQGSLLQRSPWHRWSPRPRHVRRAQEDHRCFLVRKHCLETPFMKENKTKQNKTQSFFYH